ncbi:MAG: glutamine amidotransferase [Azospirillaceae bacterium]
MTGIIKVLLAGESWVSTASHIKGFDQFSTVTYHTGADALETALSGTDIALTVMPAHLAARDFPQSMDALAEWDVVVLSDLGANTLLLHPDTWVAGKPTPNRLKLLRRWVEEQGGGLLMCGGYYSFQGINGGARYRATPVEAVLPVSIHPFDDRVEVPEGFTAEVLDTGPDGMLDGLDAPWPLLLGLNETVAKADARVLARAPEEDGGHPLLAVGEAGRGRTAAWTSDIGPHWCPDPFCAWPGYPVLWRRLFTWLAGR